MQQHVNRVAGVVLGWVSSNQVYKGTEVCMHYGQQGVWGGD